MSAWNVSYVAVSCNIMFWYFWLAKRADSNKVASESRSGGVVTFGSRWNASRRERVSCENATCIAPPLFQLQGTRNCRSGSRGKIQILQVVIFVSVNWEVSKPRDQLQHLATALEQHMRSTNLWSALRSIRIVKQPSLFPYSVFYPFNFKDQKAGGWLFLVQKARNDKPKNMYQGSNLHAIYYVGLLACSTRADSNQVASESRSGGVETLWRDELQIRRNCIMWKCELYCFSGLF